MKVKYPRTLHLPFSEGRSSDDKALSTTAHFEGKMVVVTEKMDGENTTLYADGFHARSIDGRSHPSRDWLKRFHAEFAHRIPSGWRICGENLYARHSIWYQGLTSYFAGFSVWNEQNVALAWDDTLEVFQDLGITPVRELYRGIYDEGRMKSLAQSMKGQPVEGFVVRTEGELRYEDFGAGVSNAIAKWVRAGHVQTDEHWMHAQVVPNVLAAS